MVTGDALFDLVRKVVEQGLPIGPALQVLILQLPGLMIYALPMAMLLGTLLTYSKLSSGNELIALRSIGVPTRRYVLPAVVLGLGLQPGQLHGQRSGGAQKQSQFFCGPASRLGTVHAPKQG